MNGDLARFGFGSLMPSLIQDVLMVASPYDCFILEEDGKFSDRMFTEYAELDLASPPHFDHVTSGKAALERMRKKHYDLVLTTPHCSDMAPERLAARIKKNRQYLPVVLLTYDRAEARNYSRDLGHTHLDQVFVWTGDPKLLVALVKIVEDQMNVAHDTNKGLVRVILVVEDSPTDYSEFLPAMYREILVQLRLLLPERLNDRHRHNRMRARPKILLARSYEEAMSLLKRYSKFLLGVISDVRFPRNKVMSGRSGVSFVRQVRKYRPELAILLQSFEEKNREIAEKLGIYFSDKSSGEFIRVIKSFMKDHFGFGDFIFLDPDGEKVDQAKDMQEMVTCLKRVPAKSIEYHARHHQISNWLFARSEFSLAVKIQPRVVDEFKDIEAVRKFLVDTFTEFFETRQRGKVADFTTAANMLARDFTRIGSGSMGGKARGVAFVSHLIASHPIHKRYPDVRIIVPRAAVVCTDLFDNFCDKHNLLERVAEAETDEDIVNLFLGIPLDKDLTQILSRIISEVRYPLAVRSSSLLEDSTFQPLAGLYRTFMLPNAARSQKTRLEQLTRSVRMVVASSFFKKARKYLESHALRPEQEKMAVLIQRLVGSHFGKRFYPDFAGVAQSYNYYPMSYMKPEDGIAALGLGLGKTVVEGGKVYRVCLKHPNIQPEFATPTAAMRASQRRFYALDLSNPSFMPGIDSGANLLSLGLEEAETDGSLEAVGATFSPENNVIYDTIYREGPRLINFSGVLKHGRFPLAPILTELLEICQEGMGCPVELEFAVAMARNGKPAELAILELRPLVAMGYEREVKLDERTPDQHLVARSRALGNGIIAGVRDIVYIHPNRLNFANSEKIAREIERINHRLCAEHRPYLLLGPGRWGSADRWLGVPVTWSQVSGVRIIVELELPNLHIDPSQGTHFFHNLISLRVGYFSVNLGKKEHLIDLDWLEAQEPETEVMGIRHVALDQPLEARIDGKSGQGVIVYGNMPWQA